MYYLYYYTDEDEDEDEDEDDSIHWRSFFIQIKQELKMPSNDILNVEYYHLSQNYVSSNIH